VKSNPAIDDAVERLTLRYRAAFDEYRSIVDKNAELFRTGDKPSEQAQLAEERAYDELDSARYALLGAAGLMDPTLH
jgi:hypothetical protein